MKTKTTYQLMELPVTDELKREVSRRVWEAMGNKCAQIGDYWWVINWELDDGKQVPDYTLPENFWPLVEKMRFNIENDWQEMDGLYGETVYSEPWWVVSRENTGLSQHYDAGLAVCFAYLKIMEDSK